MNIKVNVVDVLAKLLPHPRSRFGLNLVIHKSSEPRWLGLEIEDEDTQTKVER